MNRLSCLTLLVCLMGLVFSCVRDEDEDFMPRLVVEGRIEDGGYPVVYLGQMIRLDGRDTMRVDDYAVRWGKVSISDGERTVVLTGNYTSQSYSHFRYETFNMRGEAGKTYRLQVEYRDQTVTAVTTVPDPPQIDSLRVVRSANDTLYYIKAYFCSDPQAENYYVLFSKRLGKDSDFLLSFMGTLDGNAVSGSVEMPVYRGSSFFVDIGEHFSRYFVSGDVVQVKLCRVDRASYLFWSGFSNLQNFSGNMFFPYTENPVTNIEGGRGCWCGYGVDTKTIVIP